MNSFLRIILFSARKQLLGRNHIILLFALLVFPFAVKAQIPTNDNPCNAAPLTVGAVCNYTSFNSTNATATPGVPAPGCGNYVTGDVWFSITVPAGGTVLLSSQLGKIGRAHV